MDEAPTLFIEAQNEISESIKIEQDKNNYLLNINYKRNSLSLNVYENEEIGSEYYTISMTLNEIKDFHIIFCGINSFKEFLEYIKALNDNKKLIIKKEKDTISINIIAEYLLKQYVIEIPLLYGKINLESIVKNVCKELKLIKEKVKNLEENLDKQNKENISIKEENKILKEKIDIQNNEINKLKDYIKNIINTANIIKKNTNIYDNSVIIKPNEFDMINKAIKIRINKEIKEIKKLYQASKDGGEPVIFHTKCDNIPNTLVLIKSAGHRRFGGFTSTTWESEGIEKKDKNAFLFSLDKHKIYPSKNKGNNIACLKDRGPIFGIEYTIKIEGNPIKDKTLYTNESSSKCFELYGDKNALSEDGNKNYIYAIDYEVFEIKFE